jgi:hypothetical protein
MKTKKIDISLYTTPSQNVPQDVPREYWAVTIAGEPVSVFRSYSEAKTVANIYTPLFQLDSANAAN